jgi:hypothetical protein
MSVRFQYTHGTRIPSVTRMHTDTIRQENRRKPLTRWDQVTYVERPSQAQTRQPLCINRTVMRRRVTIIWLPARTV